MATERKIVIMGGNLVGKTKGSNSGPVVKIDGGKVVQVK